MIPTIIIWIIVYTTIVIFGMMALGWYINRKQQKEDDKDMQPYTDKQMAKFFYKSMKDYNESYDGGCHGMNKKRW